jgi:DNA-binding MarR family transcriptional regulator
MPSNSERDLVAGIIQLANLITRRLAPIFEKARITPQQWAILSALDGSDTPMTLAGMARRMMVSKQNMTGMIARLEQLGLADRAGDPHDLRSSRVQLTRRGRSLVEKFRPAYEEWRGAMGEELSDRDLAAVTRVVEKLLDQLSAGE